MTMTTAVTPQELNMEMTGRMEVTVIPGADESCRCGPIGAPRNLAYRVIVTSAPDHLDANGFVIDWQVIRDWFDEAFKNLAVFPSCERIACQACSHIVALLDDRALRVEVTIGSAATPAGMTAVWRRNHPSSCFPFIS